MLITGHRYSYAVYTGDGITATFTIPFPYLSKSFIDVTVNDTPVPLTALEWLSDSLLRITPTPAKDSTVRIQRNTEKATPLVDFSDGSVLTEKDLDTNTAQMLHIVQEAYDISEGLGDILEKLPSWEGALAIFAQVQQALYLVYDFIRRVDPGASPPETISCRGAAESAGVILISCEGAEDDGGRTLIGGQSALGAPGELTPERVGIILGGGGAGGYILPPKPDNPDEPGGGGGGEGPEPPGPDGGDGVVILFCGNAPEFTPDYVLYCGVAGTLGVDGIYSAGGADNGIAPNPDPDPTPDPDPKPDPTPDPDPDPDPDPEPPAPTRVLLFCGNAPAFTAEQTLNCGLASPPNPAPELYSAAGAAEAPTV